MTRPSGTQVVSAPATAAEDQWKLQYRAVWGPHDWQEGAVIAISRAWEEGGKPRFALAGTAPASDPEAVWRLVEHSERTSRATYVTVGVLGSRPSTGRGRADDVIGLPALFIDADTADGHHAPSPDGRPHPTRAQVDELIAACPWGPPTCLIDSGGGLHAYWTLMEPLVIAGAEGAAGREVLERWEAWWLAAAERMGVAWDRGVARDGARVLRPAGSHNRKGAAVPVTVVDAEAGRRYYVEDIDAYLPKLAPAARAAAASAATRPAATIATGDRPGDRLSRTPGAVALLVEALGLMPADDRGARWRYPRPDGSVTTADSHAEIYLGADGIERLVAYGARLQQAWEVDGPLDAFGLLVGRVCGGDASLAARIIIATGADPDRIAAQVVGRPIEDLQRAYPPRGWSLIRSAGSGDIPALPDLAVPGVGVAPGTASMRMALESPTPVWVPVNDDATRVVVLDAHRSYGTWAVSDESDEKSGARRTRLVRIASWLVWRPSVTQVLAADTTGRATAVGESTYDVEVLTSRGRRARLTGLDARDADSLKAVVAAANAGVEVPESRNDAAAQENVLRMLGRDEQEERVSYATTGWVYDAAGHLVFAAPGGSVDARGPRPDVRVVAPMGSDRGSLEGSMLHDTRVDNLPSDQGATADAVRCVADACSITPRRTEVMTAIIGLVFSAPLLLPVRGVPVIQGARDTGKSLLAALAMSFQSDKQMSTQRLPISIPRSSTKGVTNACAWARGLTIAGDDWRIEGLGRTLLDSARGAMTALVQAGYGSAQEVKATRSGGLHTGGVLAASVLVTGELGPIDEAQTSRSVHLIVRRGDIAIDGEQAPYDVWKSRYGSGGANVLFSAYLQWLAAQAEAHPHGLVGLTAQAEEYRRGWAAVRHGERTTEVVASLAAGWHYLRTYAQSVGLEELLPDEAAVTAGLDRLASGNADVAQQRSLGQRLVDQLATMIQGGGGHLASARSECPRHAIRYGWAEGRTYANAGLVEAALSPQGPQLGWVDGERVVISRRGLQVAWAAVQDGAPWHAETAERALTPYLELSPAGGPACIKARLGDQRRRGYPMTLATLGLDVDE